MPSDIVTPEMLAAGCDALLDDDRFCNEGGKKSTHNALTLAYRAMVRAQPQTALTSAALAEFENLLVAWIDRYAEGLQAGGSGNPAELAQACAAWARKNL